MALASPVIEEEFTLARVGGGRITCTKGAESAVIYVDRTQEAAVPAGAELLSTFLDDFQSQEDIAKHLPDVRREIAREDREAGAPVTLRSLRLEKGMSQQQFAKAIGTSQSAVSLLEARRQKPTEDTIRAMASALDTDFNTLMDALANG